MKKEKLKTGHIVELRSGALALVMKNNTGNEDGIFFKEEHWVGLGNFDEDTLEWHTEDEKKRTEHTKSIDIMKVYEPRLPCYSITLNIKESRCIWERKENKKTLSIEEIENLLGFEVNIIK